MFDDAGYQGVPKREGVQRIQANWHVAMRPGNRRALDKSSPLGPPWRSPDISRPSSVPRWSTRFGSSSASSAL